MIRVFDRYISVRNSVYFICESLVVFTFIFWGTTSGYIARGGIEFYLIAALLICQFSLYCSDLGLPVPRFSFNTFFWGHCRAFLGSALVVFLIFLLVPPPETLWSPLGWRLVILPFLLIGLRLAYQAAVTIRRWDTTILIIGSAPVASLIKNMVFYDRSLGYRAIHFRWDLTSPDTLAEEWGRLSSIVAEHQITTVLIALHDRRGQLPVESLLGLRILGVEVLDACSFYEKISGRLLVQSLRPSNLIFGDGFCRPSPLRVSKRFLDVIFCIVGCVLAIPFFIILSILIKIDSRGPVLYRQERVGEKGKPFMLMKFRSMYEDAEVKSGPIWAEKDDPRLTRVGRVMRGLRFDEIPQLINVLKGEMSLVGPRPERPVFVERLRKTIPYYVLRLSVKPGLTGWAQVKYRYGATEKEALEKLEYDLYYIRHLSVLFDLTIIFETIRVVFTRSGAH